MFFIIVSLIKYKKCKFNLKRFRNSRAETRRYAYGLGIAAIRKANICAILRIATIRFVGQSNDGL